jgi:ribosome-associated heat shock protein Hsp15
MPEDKKVRIDKWLWSVRIFKTRSLATDMCKAGKVKSGGDLVKPAHHVRQGELITVRKNGFDFRFRVIELLEKRVGAPLAQKAYDDLTPAEELTKYNAWFVGKAGAEYRDRGTGRPTKKERREIDSFKANTWDWEDDE